MNSRMARICTQHRSCGGELVMEDKILNTRMNTVMMDGATKLHWNLPITSGTKYSVIFFNA